MAQRTLPPPARAERLELAEAPSWTRRLAYRLFEPVDGSSLAVFRIIFGAIMVWEVWRYFSNGWIDRYFIAPEFHFTFYAFGWVRPWAGDGMYWHFAILGVLAICITLGLAYRLFEPIDGSSLAVFRIIFGAIMVWEVWRYFTNDWIDRYFIAPEFHFTFYGFGWVEPWAGDGMYWHFAILGVLAICITLGLAYRIVMPLFFLGFTYVFLLEQARYLNHFYLIALLAFLMSIVPAHRVWSLDARRAKGRWKQTVPTWSLWLLRIQLGIVFVGASVAKWNGDWIRGQPMHIWLGERTDFAILGHFFDEMWIALLFSWGGLLLDLLLVPFLLIPLTRPLALIAAFGFHFMNSKLFTIGIFPWLALGTALLFFPANWPRRVLTRIRLNRFSLPRPPLITPVGSPPAGWRVSRGRALLLTGLGVYIAVQLFMPLRHWLYPGNVSWTEEGHRFAWHMKLRDKEAEARFFAVDPSGRSSEVDPFEYLTEWQYEEMAARPDMIVQFAQHLGRDVGERFGVRDVRVTADVRAALNGREFQQMIDPAADLTEVELSPFTTADYIEPLRTPLS